MKQLRFIFLPFILICFYTISSYNQNMWTKHPSNPVIPHWTGDIDDPNGYKYAFSPGVLVDDNRYFRIFFNSLAFGYGTKFCISEGVSFDGYNWFVKAKNPIIRPGLPGSFDSEHLRSPRILKDKTGYKIYYSGFNGQKLEIGLATSTDLQQWSKYSNNPIINVGQAGTWESIEVRYPVVFLEHVYNDSVYKMWYEGYNGNVRAIGYATSPDGINWTKYTSNPVLIPGPSEFDINGVGTPSVIKVGDIYHMTYTGFDKFDIGRIGYAFSKDGINWQKYTGNPIVDIGPANSWDNAFIGGGTIVFQNGKFHLWYSGKSSYTRYWQIGYATADSVTVFANIQDELPKSFQLISNYPNPFNPGTTITYKLPSSGKVTIRIFDIMGQEIIMLHSGYENLGTYSIRWEGKDSNGIQVSSGTYIVSAEFIDQNRNLSSQSQKILLLR